LGGPGAGPLHADPGRVEADVRAGAAVRVTRPVPITGRAERLAAAQPRAEGAAGPLGGALDGALGQAQPGQLGQDLLGRLGEPGQQPGQAGRLARPDGQVVASQAQVAVARAVAGAAVPAVVVGAVEAHRAEEAYDGLGLPALELGSLAAVRAGAAG